MKGIKTLTAVLLSALCLPAAAPAYAVGVGVATYDNTAEMNALQQLAQWAEQLQDNIQSLRNEAQQLLNPGIEFYEGMSDSYRDIIRTADGIMSDIDSASSTIAYIQENLGDADYWTKCVRNHCNPEAQIDSAYRALNNVLNRTIGMSRRIGEETVRCQEKVQGIVNATGNAGDEGVNATMVRLTEVQAVNAQLLSQIVMLQQAQAQQQAVWMAKMENERELERQENESFFTDAPETEIQPDMNPRQWFRK